MFEKDLVLQDLVNLEYWQKVQDLFSEAFGVTLRTVKPDYSTLTRTSRPTRLCSLCSCVLAQNKQSNTENPTEITNFKCPFELNVFIIPVKVINNSIAAYLVTGPVRLLPKKDYFEYAKDAEKLGITLQELEDMLIEIDTFTYNKIYSVTKLLETVFSNMVQTAYHKRRLGEIAPEIAEMDPLFAKYHEEKILNALLNACTLLLDADSGSVMTVDKKTNTLSIKVSSKLEDGAKDSAHMKIGEGIAGVAAATSQPIILPKDEAKNQLSGKLRRSYIKSSMIVPFEKGNTHQVYGVINLNILRKGRDFSERDIALVKELVKLASTALAPISA